jgi:GT2 family glycosyltransferase
MNLSVAITITTHNRLEELLHTCGVIARLNPQPEEFIICADGCTDGTVDFVREHVPSAKLLVHNPGRGSIPSRNRMIREARADIVLSLDDDSHPLESDALARISRAFEENPNLAVASLPQRSNEFPETLDCTDFGPPKVLASYANCAAALRRETFLELGGYPDFFTHIYEEPDYALRCLAKGWAVRFEPVATIRHLWTPSARSEIRVHHRQARNECWSVLMRCPWMQIPAVLAFRVLRQFGYAMKRGGGWMIREPQWWLAFLSGVPQALVQRSPVPWPAYFAWMKLFRAR